MVKAGFVLGMIHFNDEYINVQECVSLTFNLFCIKMDFLSLFSVMLQKHAKETG